ncbi:hypothetical protein AB0H77_03350 [Streptomyces sp. NPDC050844]|uniref:hypothetical protein n=1 Tax=Streptomyces sp. NPDC050844 TaxID=3155790 RepID=UPI0033CFC9FC
MADPQPAGRIDQELLVDPGGDRARSALSSVAWSRPSASTVTTRASYGLRAPRPGFGSRAASSQCADPKASTVLWAM